MSEINQVQLLDNSVYDLVDAYKSGIYTVIGTQTAATGSWTGALHGVSALYDGLTIMYYLPWAGSGNATLNLTLDDGTTTGAVDCYYATNTRLTTHYVKGSNIVMTYWSAGSISIDGTATTNNRWIANGNYADGNDNAYYVRRIYSSLKAGANKIFPYTIIMENNDNRWESIVTSASTATTKTRNTHGFRLGQVLINYADATYDENVEIAKNNIWDAYTNVADMRYSFNVANDATYGMTAKKPVYLVGSLASDGLFYLDTTWWTHTLPSTEDGKLYIHIGEAYDRYRIDFIIHNPIYHYSNGAVREFVQDAGTVNGHTVGIDVPSDAVFTDHTYSGTGLISVNSSGVISTTAEVNQNAFSNIKVGSTTIAADSKTDTVELVAGDNVTLTPDATNDKVTISATDTTYESKTEASGGTDLSLVTTGEKYIWNHATGTDTIPSGYCDTAGGTAAKVVQLTGYTNTANQVFMLTLVNANTYAGEITLNVNSTGAKTLYINGQVSSASNYTLPAGSYLVSTSDGTKYSVRTDGKLPIDISGSANTVNGYTVEKNVPSNAVFTDEKVTQTGLTSPTDTAYRVILSNSNNNTTETAGVKKSDNFAMNPYTDESIVSGKKATRVVIQNTTASTNDYAEARLELGNSKTTASTDGKDSYGVLRIFDQTQYKTDIYHSTTLTGNRNLYLPNKTGTVAVTDDIVDENVAVVTTDPTSGTWYYPTWYDSVGGTTGKVNANNGLRYYTLQGTTSAEGRALLQIGNSTSSGTAGNKYGELRIYSKKNAYANLVYYANATANKTITFPAEEGIVFINGGSQLNIGRTQFYNSGNQSTYLYFNGTTELEYGVWMGVSGTWYVYPLKDAGIRLGHSSYRWGQIYSSSSSISTSDRKEKKDIVPLDETAKDFIMALNPVSYKMINGETGRTHYGMIAQDVEEELEDLGMTAMDFAGFCKDQKEQPYIDSNGDRKSMPVQGEYVYGLRYEEFIAPMIKTIQMQQQEIDELKSELAEIKALLLNR